MNLFLIRHGQSYVNLSDWDGGNTDAGLTDLGVRQAEALAKWLQPQLPDVDMIYCSTMLRARETVAPLSEAYAMPVHYDDRLREIGNNRYDHTAWPSEGLPEYGDIWGSERPFTSTTPAADGGETLMHFRTRVGMFIEDMISQHRSETVVAVCHGGVIEAAYNHVFNIGPWQRCEIWCRNTGITRFEYVEHPNRELWRLHYHSRTEHYDGLRPAPEKS